MSPPPPGEFFTRRELSPPPSDRRGRGRGRGGGRGRGRGRSSPPQVLRRRRPARESSLPRLPSLDLSIGVVLGEPLLALEPPSSMPSYIVCSSPGVRYGPPGPGGFQSRVILASSPFRPRRSSYTKVVSFEGGVSAEELDLDEQVEPSAGGVLSSVFPDRHVIVDKEHDQPFSQKDETISIFGGDTLQTLGLEDLSLKQLSLATNSFSKKNTVPILGSNIFSGLLDNTEILVKVLRKDRPGELKEGMLRVLSSSVRKHPNIIELFGLCKDDPECLFLVYPFQHKTSLFTELSGGKSLLSWESAVRLSVSIAEGLNHVVSIGNPPIIPDSVTASHIFFSDLFEPQVVDLDRIDYCIGNCSGATSELIRCFGIILLQIVNSKVFDKAQEKLAKALLNLAFMCTTEYEQPTFESIIQNLNEISKGLHDEPTVQRGD